MDKVIRYQSAVDDSQWDIDSGTVHYVEHGRTLCGTRVPSTRESRGRWEPSWYDVSCKRCIAKAK